MKLPIWMAMPKLNVEMLEPVDVDKMTTHLPIHLGRYIIWFVEVCAHVSDEWGWNNIAIQRVQFAVLYKM